MNRFYLLRAFFLCWFFAVGVRLFYWQGIKANELQLSARKQYERSTTAQSIRGTITSADGYPLVLNERVYTLILRPNLVRSDTKVSQSALMGVLQLDPASASALLRKFEDPSKKWVPLMSNLTEEQKTAIESLKFPEFAFEPELRRMYPEASLSAHVFGFVGSDLEGKAKGYFGLEGEYDLELAGQSSKQVIETDAVGHQIGLSATSAQKNLDGRGLTLTLRRDIQHLVEKYLEDGIRTYGAKSGDVLIMEPSTGKVIAAAAFPKYDPRNFKDSDQSLFKNPIVADAYEPGSTFKILTVASGIDSGVIKPETVCDRCSGPVTIGKYTIKTWDNRYHAGTTIQDGLTHSDNTAMVFVGSKMGKDTQLSYLSAFGLGTKTGIDLQEESASPLRERRDWGEIDLATATFGQGIAVTPIQLLNIANTIANGGVLMRPYLVDTVSGDGQLFHTKPQPIRQVISKESAQVVAAMMQRAASTGDAKWTLPKQYPIAGKTGTAQIPVAGHYDETRTIASFVGFSPVHDPKFSMLVRLVEPTTSQWGSETAAPLWFAIAKELFIKYGISPIAK